MTEFSNLFELLRAVRAYELQKGEGLAPSNSIRGTHVGFCTVDSVGPSTRWVISIDALRASCEGSEEAQGVYHLMRSHQGRRELLLDLRAGKLHLEGPTDTPPKQSETQEIPSEEDEQLRSFLETFNI
jgi:hypothetical protein